MLGPVRRLAAFALATSTVVVGSTSYSLPPIFTSKRLVEEYPALGPMLRDAVDESEDFANLTSVKLNYGLFEGRSDLRALVADNIDEREDGASASARLLRPSTFGIFRPRNEKAFRRAVAILLLLKDPRRNVDAAHELILGVTPHNMPQAEFAKTNREAPRGKEWNDAQLPFDASSDLIHAIIHRLEGNRVGEGGYRGWENAKYWLGGGPKESGTPDARHDARRELAAWARANAPLCVSRRGVVSGRTGGEGGDDEGGDAAHAIVAGGGTMRTVRVPRGDWDGFAFCDVCKLRVEGRLDEEESREVGELQRMEMLLLLEYELAEAGFCATFREPATMPTR